MQEKRKMKCTVVPRLWESDRFERECGDQERYSSSEEGGEPKSVMEDVESETEERDAMKSFETLGGSETVEQLLVIDAGMFYVKVSKGYLLGDICC